MKIFVSILLAGLVAGTAVRADTVSILDRNDPPNSPEGVPRPVRGMSMEAELAKFGEPRRRLDAVGDPPITRWVYDRFTVYFEYQTTLHAVINRSQSQGG